MTLLRTPLAVACATICACTTQHSTLPQPNAGEALDHLSVQTGTIHHALLSPVALDVRDGLTLDEATALAVAANPRLRTVRAEKGIAAAQLVQAEILPNPELSAGAEAPAFGVTAGQQTTEHIDVAWEVSALFTRDAEVQVAAAHEREVELDIAWQEWQVALEARVQWRRLAAIEAQIAISRSTEADLRTVLETLERARQTRDVTTVEVAAAHSALDDAALATKEIERSRARAMRALARVLGVRADSAISLQGADVSVPAPPPVDELRSQLAERRLDLLALRFGYESAEARVRAAVLSRIPRLAFDVGVARDNAGAGTVGLGVTVGLPIFDRAQGRVGLETATRSRVRDEYAARVFEANADLDDAYAEVLLAREAAALADESLPRAEALVATYRTALSEHLVDIPSVYAAINALNARRIDALRRHVEIADLTTALELTSGRLLSTTTSTTRSLP